MLVLLRIGLGWHFLYQGISKFQNPGFSAVALLQQAKGPLADVYYDLIPDRDGLARLDGERVVAAWGDLRDQTVEFYRFSEEQQAVASKLFEHRQERLETYLDESSQEIEDYRHELARFEETKRKADVRQVAFQEKRNWDKRTELHGKGKQLTAGVDAIEQDFRNDLASLLEDDQRARGAVPVPVDQLQIVNLLTKYSNVIIGGCLIAGLFTRFAALSGGLFLLTIVLAQPPWPNIYPPNPPQAGRSLLVNKEAVEMLALFAIAALPVGRWGGLDFYVHYWILRPLFGKKA